MPSWRSSLSLFLLAFVLMHAAGAQTRTYLAFESNVPFSFSVGDRKFHAGNYQFLVVGAGLMAMRDGHGNMLTTLLTRDLRGEERSGSQPRLVFEKSKNHTRLTSIWMAKGIQGFEILREEVASRPIAPQQPEDLMLNLPVGANLRAPRK